MSVSFAVRQFSPCCLIFLNCLVFYVPFHNYFHTLFQICNYTPLTLFSHDQNCQTILLFLFFISLKNYFLEFFCPPVSFLTHCSVGLLHSDHSGTSLSTMDLLCPTSHIFHFVEIFHFEGEAPRERVHRRLIFDDLFLPYT